MSNRIKILWLAIVACCASYAQQARISVEQVFDKDTTLYLFNTRSQISRLSVNMSITKHSPKFFARVVLEDQNHKNYLVGETYKEIADEDTSYIFEWAEETELLNCIVPYRLKIYVEDASVELKTIDLTDGMLERGKNEDNLKFQKIKSKVDKINAYNNTHLKIWSAGFTELSKMPFEDRMRVLGFDESYNTGGFEYYTGGIFEVGEREDYTPNRSGNNTFVDEFDWTNRHGKNWMTSIKGQGYSNYCSAFTAVACLEALTNLYYNQKIDLDLSELETANCCGSPFTPTYTHGLVTSYVVEYLRDTGVCDELSYPFFDDPNDTLCRSDQINPQYRVKINDYCEIPSGFCQYEDSLKKFLINYGPMFSGFFVSNDPANENKPRSHAMALVGYGTIHAGDSIRIISSDPNNSSSTISAYYVVSDSSPLIGRTYFKFKNSNNIRPNDDVDGYMHLLFNDLTRLVRPIRFLYPFTITNCQTNQPMYTDNDIVCEDNDGDGYYFWGLGPKPTNCPATVPNDPDGDDSDPSVGPMDGYGNLSVLANEIIISSLVGYNSVINPSHDIRIVNGGQLCITNTTTLHNNAQITVENGGILTIDGGILNKARISLCAGSTLIIQNDGTINMATGEEFYTPVGASVTISNGKIV
jgi:hypothetical protein